MSGQVHLASADALAIGSDIEEFARLSEPGAGVTRLAYSRLERRAHDIFAARMSAVGAEVHVDAAGNTVATIAGRSPGAAIGTGSHLDSVYSGGRFDGTAGVVSAMHVASLLVESGYVPYRPLRFVVFAGEEGARFGQACIGSRLAAGLTIREDLDTLADRDGVSLADAMRAVGVDPDAAAATPWSAAEWAVFVELHIEQGSVLEQRGIPIGLVDLISGSTRVAIRCTGRASHSGGTPMPGRADALTAAAEAVLAAERIASDVRHRGARATVGRLTVEPNSLTTIPGVVEFVVDVRDIDADRQRSTATDIVDAARAAGVARGVDVSWRVLADTSPVVLPTWVRQAIATATAGTGHPYRVLASGASHDTQMIARLAPAGMIFVPSANGLSHVPEEWTDADDLARGTDVLAATIVHLDGLLAQAPLVEADASTPPVGTSWERPARVPVVEAGAH